MRLAFLAGSILIHAACPPYTSLRDEAGGLLNKVANIDGHKLVDADAYAREVKSTPEVLRARYAATGTLQCQNSWGQASLVGNQRTIVTAMHVTMEGRHADKKCGKLVALTKCKFIIDDKPKNIEVPVKKIYAAGACPKGERYRVRNDWAILELAGEVPSKIKPFALPNRDEVVKTGQRLVLAGRASGFNPNKIKEASPGMSFPKGYVDCTAMGSSDFVMSGAMQTNCPSSGGGSGSGVVTPGDSPKLMGVLAASITTKEACKHLPNQADDGEFEWGCRATTITPASGDFLDALESLPKN